jgi:hypothetical protein
MNNPESLLIITALIALPAAWLWAEFRNRRRLRILFGLAALILPYAYIALLIGFYDWGKTEERRLDDSVQRLLEESIHELKSGEKDGLLKLWQQVSKDYYPGAKPVMNRRAIDDALEKRKRDQADRLSMKP